VRAHNDFIVIPRRGLVSATRVNNRNKTLVLPFHLAIRESQLSQEFHTPDLEPDEMVGMIDDSHLVSFGIAHA
jgi:hypothetical protein